MPNGMHRRHEHVIDAGIGELGHMPVHELDRIASLPCGMLLSCTHRLLIGGVGEEHVEAELGEKRIRQREEFVHEQAARYADSLLRRVARRDVSIEHETLRLLEQDTVGLSLLRIGFIARPDRPRKVEAAKDASLLAKRRIGAAKLIEREQGCAESSRDGEMRRDAQCVAEMLSESLDDAGIVGDAALQDHMPPYGTRTDDAMQEIAHDGLAQPGSDVLQARSLGERGVYGGLHEHGAAFPQIDGRRARKREGTESIQRDSQACSLLLHERTGAGSANLVHLEFDDLPGRHRNVLRILAAYLEHRIRARIDLGCRTRLRRDLVAHQIGTDELGQTRTPRSRRDDSPDVQLVAEALAEGGKPVARSAERIPARAQVLGIEKAPFKIRDRDVRACGSGIDSYDAGDAPIRPCAPRPRTADVPFPRLVSMVHERRAARKRVVEGLRLEQPCESFERILVDAVRCGKGGTRRSVSRSITRPIRIITPGESIPGMQRRPHGLGKLKLFSYQQLVVPKLERFAHGAHDSSVSPSAARQRDGSLDGHAPNDRRLVAFDRREA